MKCELCKTDKPLLKKSHIIPDFMYEGLFDEKHFTSLVKLDELRIIGKKPTGFYDKNILCKKCDNEIIGQHESYASKILHGGKFSERLKYKITSFSKDQGAGKLSVENIDYKKFKLFLLSMLWKGHISKNEFFKSINLGQKYSEEIRKMLLNEDPGKETDFETMIVMYSKDFLPAKMLIPPRKVRMSNTICYLIHIQGVSFLYKVSSGHRLESFENSKLREDNSAQFYVLEGEIARSFYNSLTGVPA
ncbi:hypothetical protein [Salinimicrobium soli]|uniref:hypothetical protein n=1 Tax=Salinimicrobium soli TaxID=1254399 RepID=UPI003AB03BF5